MCIFLLFLPFLPFVPLGGFMGGVHSLVEGLYYKASLLGTSPISESWGVEPFAHHSTLALCVSFAFVPWSGGRAT